MQLKKLIPYILIPALALGSCAYRPKEKFQYQDVTLEQIVQWTCEFQKRYNLESPQVNIEYIPNYIVFDYPKSRIVIEIFNSNYEERTKEQYIQRAGKYWIMVYTYQKSHTEQLKDLQAWLIDYFEQSQQTWKPEHLR